MDNWQIFGFGNQMIKFLTVIDTVFSVICDIVGPEDLAEDSEVLWVSDYLRRCSGSYPQPPSGT